jgi:Ca-activated chloride channel family protein
MKSTIFKTAALLALTGVVGCAAEQKAMDEVPAEMPVESDDSEMARPAPAADHAAPATGQAERTVVLREAEEAAPAPAQARRRAPMKKKAEARPIEDNLLDADHGAIAPRDQAEATGTEAYEDYGVNEMTSAEEDRFSTFSIDVDTGSYTIARKKLNQGYLPPAAAVRVEEFVNYFSYHYPSPDDGAFGVHLEAAPSPFSAEKDKYLVRVGVQGKRISPAQRKPVHLTFLVDVSGSMSAPDKLPLAKKSLKLLTRNLRQGDTVALATYAGHTAKILEPTGMQHRRKILRAIDNLGAGGGTGMSNGMELAYKMALTNFEREHVNRVIVMSDGDANIGPMSHQEIHQRIRHYVAEGVTLSTIGFGMGNYKDTMMEQLANNGNGNYYYLDDFKEAKKVFESQLDGTLQVIAKDVKIQVEFDPDKIPEYRLIGYENRDIADEDFRDDKVDAGEIGAGHTVTALYEVKLNRKAEGRLATVRVRAKKPDGYKAAEQQFHLTDGDMRRRLSNASKDFQFAASVSMFAEILRGSPYAEGISLDLVEEVARSATGWRQDDRKEFLELIRKAKRLRRG